MTKVHLLEGTSKWSAKVAIRGQTDTLGVLAVSVTLVWNYSHLSRIFLLCDGRSAVVSPSMFVPL